MTQNADDVSDNGPGEWVQKTRRGGPSLEHQSEMSGKPIKIEGNKHYIDEYEVNGVAFDDFKNGDLIDYKHPDRYGNFINENNEFYTWFDGAMEARKNALRQVKAANGTPVVWHVGKNQVEAFRKAVGSIPGLKIVE